MEDSQFHTELFLCVSQTQFSIFDNLDRLERIQYFRKTLVFEHIQLGHRYLPEVF